MNSRRSYTIMSPDDVLAGKKAQWFALEINGEYSSPRIPITTFSQMGRLSLFCCLWSGSHRFPEHRKRVWCFLGSVYASSGPLFVWGIYPTFQHDSTRNRAKTPAIAAITTLWRDGTNFTRNDRFPVACEKQFRTMDILFFFVDLFSSKYNSSNSVLITSL